MQEGSSLHVAVFPWLAFGHMMPMLELSKSLAKRGHRISYLATPRNISRLPITSPSDVAPLIDFVPLPLPPVAGLPADAEATSDLPGDKVQYLKIALDGLQEPFVHFLQQTSPKPDWLILDVLTHWAATEATKFSIPCALFSVYTASWLSFLGPVSELSLEHGSRKTAEQFTVPPDWFPFPSKFAYSLYSARDFMGVYRVNASGFSDADRFRETVKKCRVIAPRSCDEVEDKYLRLLRDLHKKPVFPVGLLAPSTATHETSNDDRSEILKWLDKQAPSSVVYIAFGSEATLSVEQLHELAMGLESSNVPFLWVFRKPCDVPDDCQVLPEGFETRTEGHGIVVQSWVPQLQVLAHPSVGCFITHAGWSSIIEALQFGIPLVLLPIYIDQDGNARLTAELGFAVELDRRQEDGFFTRTAVAKTVRLVMVEEEGEGVRLKAKEMSKVFADRERHERCIDDFVKFMQDHRDD